MQKLSNKKRRIVLVTSHAARGGTLDFLTMLRTHFIDRGYEAEIVALYRGRNYDQNVPMTVLVDAEKMNPLTFALTLVRYAALCWSKRPSIFIGVMPMANLFAAAGARVTFSQGIATHHNPYSTQSHPLRIIDRVFGHVGMYDAIVCVSNAVRDSFSLHSTRYRQRLRVILNGIKITEPTQSPTQTYTQFSLSQDCPVLLIVGRLSEQKNVLNAVRAFEAVPNAQLAIAGDGPLRDEVTALVRRSERLNERVILLGNIPKQDVINLLYASTVFVQVSLYEGHSLALLEAISASAAVVVSNVPSQLEAVRLDDGTLGALICDPDMTEDIAQAMSSAAFDMQIRAMLAKRVGVLRAKLRSESDMIDDYEQLFKELRR